MKVKRQRRTQVLGLLLAAALLGTVWVRGLIAPAESATVALLQPGFGGDTTADAVLGQIDLVKNVQNFVDGRGVNLPAMLSFGIPPGYGDVAIDKSVSPNRVFVVDFGNNRVLGWSSIAAFSTHAAANIVIGQPDFNSHGCNTGGVSAGSLCYPRGVAVDPAGRLYVADWSNSRALEYNSPFTTDRIADDVFGQLGLFTTNYCNGSSAVFFLGGTPPPPTSDSLCLPTGVATDAAGNVYIADGMDNRVLEYITPEAITAATGSGDTSADRVFGQPGFTANAVNNGGVSSASLSDPQGIAVDGTGDVYIADTGNNRVLEFDAFRPTLCQASRRCANRVFGQLGHFSTQVCNFVSINPDSLCTPLRVAVDSSGNLYVADYDNHRVLEYNTPLAAGGDTTADRVFGQGGSPFTANCNNGGLSANSLCNPAGIAVDGARPNNLYVADTANNRVLKFTDPIGTNTTADGVVGQAFSTIGIANFVDGRGFGFQDPGGSPAGAVAIDKSVSPNRVYVADPGNNRVLAWNDIAAFHTHAAANLVFGQANFFLSTANAGGIKANTLWTPMGVAVDTAGNLYVADTNNSRVVEYNTPFAVTAVTGSGDTVADRVFGQLSFTAGFCNRLAVTPNSSTLCQPRGVALDSANRLYIGDSGNDRVVEFDTPLGGGPSLCGASGRCASRVFGQGGAFNTSNINKGGESADSLWNPWGVTLDRSSPNHLYVADFSNHRVLEYDSPLISTTANHVFGQSGFGGPTNCNQNAAAPTAATLCYPRWVAANSAGTLYVSDTGNNRVLKYVSPLANAIADRVFGQGGAFQFTLNNCYIGPNGLCAPNGIAVDGLNNLYVTDASNYRVVEYYAP